MIISFRRPFAALALTGALALAATSSFAQKPQIDRSNLHAIPATAPDKGGEKLVPAPFPSWPPALAGTQYYKLSAFNGYYEVPTKKYFYFSTDYKKWIGSSLPPMGFARKDPNTFGGKPIAYRGASPWHEQTGGRDSAPTPPPTTTKPDNTGRPAPGTVPQKGQKE